MKTNSNIGLLIRLFMLIRVIVLWPSTCELLGPRLARDNREVMMIVIVSFTMVIDITFLVHQVNCNHFLLSPGFHVSTLGNLQFYVLTYLCDSNNETWIKSFWDESSWFRPGFSNNIVFYKPYKHERKIIWQ